MLRSGVHVETRTEHPARARNQQVNNFKAHFFRFQLSEVFMEFPLLESQALKPEASTKDLKVDTGKRESQQPFFERGLSEVSTTLNPKPLNP